MIILLVVGAILLLAMIRPHTIWMYVSHKHNVPDISTTIQVQPCVCFMEYIVHKGFPYSTGVVLDIYCHLNQGNSRYCSNVVNGQVLYICLEIRGKRLTRRKYMSKNKDFESFQMNFILHCFVLYDEVWNNQRSYSRLTHCFADGFRTYFPFRTNSLWWPTNTMLGTHKYIFIYQKCQLPDILQLHVQNRSRVTGRHPFHRICRGTHVAFTEKTF